MLALLLEAAHSDAVHTCGRPDLAIYWVSSVRRDNWVHSLRRSDRSEGAN
jgi:hypothetical protein